jgi:hypothetical protein
MANYEPSTPRAAFGVVACALTIATISLLVVGPTFVAQYDDGGVVAQRVTAPVAADTIRVLPSVDVVATRDGKPEPAQIGTAQIPSKLQS